MLKNQSGFTLIEMLIVLAVISLLLILIVPNLTEQNQSLNDKSEEVLIQMADNQTQAYFIDHGHYPSSIEVLVNAGYLTSDKLSNGSKQLIYDNSVPPNISVVEVEND